MFLVDWINNKNYKYVFDLLNAVPEARYSVQWKTDLVDQHRLL